MCGAQVGHQLVQIFLWAKKQGGKVKTVKEKQQRERRERKTEMEKCKELKRMKKC